MKTEVDATPFTDLLFNLVIGIFAMFAMAYMLIKAEAQTKEVSTQAEFIITVTWPDNNADDVDTWIEDPLGNLVWFQNKEKGLMHLDRDDLGKINDTVYLPDGTSVIYPYNQEITTIRGFLAGEWVLNIHMYTKRVKESTPVHVTFDKLNPSFKNIFAKEVLLTEHFEEATVARFEMTAEGKIMSVDDLPKELVKR